MITSSRPEVFCKKETASIFKKKEAPEQVFSCEFCEMFKNTFPYGALAVAASEWYLKCNHQAIGMLRKSKTKVCFSDNFAILNVWKAFLLRCQPINCKCIIIGVPHILCLNFYKIFETAIFLRLLINWCWLIN